MSISLCKTRCLNLTTHFNLQNKSLRKLSSEHDKLSAVVKDYLNNHKKPNSLDLTLIPRQLRHINETIVRICTEFASTRDVVNIYHTFSKSHLYKLIECPTFGHSSANPGYDLLNQISKEGNFKFTLFSLEQQCLRQLSVIYPYQIAILISSHLRLGRCNEIFITELLSSFARLNESKVRIPFYNPNTLSLMVHVINVCKKSGINSNIFDTVIDFILLESANCADKFMPLDTVTLTYSLVKYGLELKRISNILLLILTRGDYDLALLRESIGRFEDLQQLSLLTNVLSCCFPVTSGQIRDKIDFEFRINMWSTVISRYYTLLSQYKIKDILSTRYKNAATRLGIDFNQVPKDDLEFTMQISEKLTNSLVSLSKAFELDYSTDSIRLTQCGLVKSKRIIYRTYRLVEVMIDNPLPDNSSRDNPLRDNPLRDNPSRDNPSLDIEDLFYGTYGRIYLLADIVCNSIKSLLLTSELVPLTLSNSVNALSRLHIQRYDYFAALGNYLSNEANLFRFSQNCIALICNSFADLKFQHPCISLLLSRFIASNTLPNVIDFYHVIMTLRKFGIYSTVATRWVIETCTKDYLTRLSSQGLINLLSYIMTYNFYVEPMGFSLTHYLIIKIGQLVPKGNFELINQFKVCSLIYHSFTPDLLDSWLKSECSDLVSAGWLRSKACGLLHKSLFINANGFDSNTLRESFSSKSSSTSTSTKPSQFSTQVADILEKLGYSVKLEHDKGTWD